MKTNSFKASTMFKFGDSSVEISLYPAEPIKSVKELEVSMHPAGKVNYFLATDCHFFLYEKHNPSIIFKDEEEYTVEDENQDYHLVAFLDKNHVLDNSIDIITKLPRGLKMKKQMAIDFNIFCFSGFNVMLFEEEPQFN